MKTPLAACPVVLLLLASSIHATVGHAQSSTFSCDAERSTPLVPTDPAWCETQGKKIRRPGALPLEEYEQELDKFLRAWCHRNEAAGWKHDKHVRATGPYTVTFQDGGWVGEGHGTHNPVVIWYSKEMIEWLHRNRPEDGSPEPEEVEPIPDGAVMIKEMYPDPAAACADVRPVTRLWPTSGAAVMIRDRQASHDGWFWGWFGWSGWDPDYPPDSTNRYPYMGFGQYCLNCHASAEDGSTFASLKNIDGEPGTPLVFLSQHFFDAEIRPSHHRLVALPGDDAPRLGQPLYAYNPDFTESLPATSLPRPTWQEMADLAGRAGRAGRASREEKAREISLQMPSETYDNVWVEAGGPTAQSTFLTSSQCLGCHDAGGTGLQFDMTVPNPHPPSPSSGYLLNVSPYATWRSSPMGLGGRDPIFFAQLASETETFHPDASEIVQDTCLGCHGILGQRQFAIDQAKNGKKGSKGKDECEPFLRVYADATPYPDGNPLSHLADYGALARDGISCTACHRMLVGEGDGPALDEPQNHCVKERQDFLNPHNKGFARTFTGSFLVGDPDELYGPFEKPKVKPMEHALNIQPVHDPAIRSSELCGSCHTVHLPVMVEGRKEPVAYVYEQTTYPEWAFSAYRTGEMPDGEELPAGAGDLAESCQSCHMPSRERTEDGDGEPYRSKIAGIQEYTNFPQAEFTLPPEEIDLQVRGSEEDGGFARHTLVGLNVFFLKMAQQFPDVLGIRTQDPMLVGKGLDPLLFSEQAMLDQASNDTAKLEIQDLTVTEQTLTARVHVESQVGHKFPSGVGFRRAFLELSVIDEGGDVLWASGRTNAAGVIVDENGDPVDGELWWNDDCSKRLGPGEYPHQPHYTKVTRQDQAQIYQELVTAPPPGIEPPECGAEVQPEGPFTTSFLSICGHLKDNRILPHGFLPLDERIRIAHALGAGDDLAVDAGPKAVGDDPDYETGGGDTLDYVVDLNGLSGTPASVRAVLYYQAIPPFYLQDRFCTSTSVDTQRLYFLSGHLNLQGTEAESWKLMVVDAERKVEPSVLASNIVKDR